MKKQPVRSEIDARYKWRLEDIYANDGLWESDFERLKGLLPGLVRYKETLTQSAEALFEALKAMDDASLISERLFVYARMRRDEDNTNAAYQAKAARAQTLGIELSAAVSYVAPLLSRTDTQLLLSFLERSAPLREHYDFMIRDIVRQKAHILSENEERLLSLSADFSSGPRDIFTMLNNADLSFGSVRDENGRMVALTHGRYQVLLQSRNREVRRRAYRRYYASYRGVLHTIAASYAASVKKDVFYAQARGYAGALGKALFADNVPAPLYDNLIAILHDSLPLMYRYLELRKKLLGLNEIRMYDVFAPLAEDKGKQYPYEDAVEICRQGLRPLGEGYADGLAQAFSQGWVDVHETRGKTSGAYSWGVYGTHPYVLLNHRGDLDSVFTLAHEIGHAMHTWYSNANQVYPKSGYAIFVAEVASTVNEILLTRHLLSTEKDADVRKYVLNHYLDQFRTTVFRQTMFAEYEKITHDMAEKGVPLTAESLSKAYEDLNALYYGERMGRDRDIAIEWTRIPHFYNAFYVYKYATGFSCAQAIAEAVLAEGQPAVARYMAFLKSGGSDYPLELLKKAGVDLASGEPVRACMRAFADALDEFERLS